MSGFTPQEGEPKYLTAGTTWTWYKTLSDYPQSAGWSIAYYLHGAFNLTISAASGPSDTQYQPTVSAASSASAYTGTEDATITWDLFVVNGSEKHAIETGTFVVRPNLSAPPTATKTHDELMLDAIRATLEGRVVADVESYQIAGRAVNRLPFDQLQKAEKYYEQKVWRKQNGKKSQNVYYDLRGGR